MSGEHHGRFAKRVSPHQPVEARQAYRSGDDDVSRPTIGVQQERPDHANDQAAGRPEEGRFTVEQAVYISSGP